MPVGDTMSPSNASDVYSLLNIAPSSCTRPDLPAHFGSTSSHQHSDASGFSEGCLTPNSLCGLRNDIQESYSDDRSQSLSPDDVTNRMEDMVSTQLLDSARLSVPNEEGGNDSNAAQNAIDSQPCFVVSRYISPQRSPLTSTSNNPPLPASHSLYTPSPSRHNPLSTSPSAASLCSTSQLQRGLSDISHGVVRSASAYTYPSLQLPIPPRSPGLSPVTRISFSTDLGSSFASSVSTPFGGSHVTDFSSPFDSSDVRLDLGTPREGGVREGSGGGVGGNALRLQGGASGLLVSLTNLTNLPGPPLYSPPPTYDQLCDPNALPTYHEATRYSGGGKGSRGGSGGVFTLPPTMSPTLPPTPSASGPYAHSDGFPDMTTTTSPLLQNQERADGGLGSLEADMADSDGGYSTILDAIPHDPALDTAPPVPVRFVPRCSLERLRPPRIRLPCLTSACNKALVRQELNRRWPFILSAQEDDRCPGLLLVECSSNLTVARLPDPRTPPDSPFGALDSDNEIRRFPSDGRSLSREARIFFPSDGRRLSVGSRRYSDETRRLSSEGPRGHHLNAERRFSTGGQIFYSDIRRLSGEGNRSTGDGRRLSGEGRRYLDDGLTGPRSPSISPFRITEEGTSDGEVMEDGEQSFDHQEQHLQHQRSRLRSESSEHDTADDVRLPINRMHLNAAGSHHVFVAGLEDLQARPPSGMRESSLPNNLTLNSAIRNQTISEILGNETQSDHSPRDARQHMTEIGAPLQSIAINSNAINTNGNNIESFDLVGLATSSSTNTNQTNSNGHQAQSVHNTITRTRLASSSTRSNNSRNDDNNNINGNTPNITLNNTNTTARSSTTNPHHNPTTNVASTSVLMGRPTVSSRSNPFANLSTTITGSVPSGIIAGGLTGSLAGLGVLDTSDLNNHVLFYLCGRCVSFDSFDADSVKVHLDLECPGMRGKWATTSELYLALRAAFFVAVVLIAFLYFIYNSI